MSVTSLEPTVVTSLSAIRQQRLDVQLRQLEFHALLHRKLELDLLFECLLVEGQAFLPFDGVMFHAAERGADVHLGSSRQYCQLFELKLGERSLGEVSLMRGRAYTAREERDAERLVESLIYPLDNALSHHAALMRTMTDVDTGLGNLPALERQLPREMNLARRCGRPLSILRIEVDELESIGERHGEDVGTHAWQSVAAALSARLRRSDMIYRTGDNTFCIVLGDTALDGAMALAERLRNEVDRCVSFENVRLMLTTSAGVTEVHQADTAESLLERAEQALREAQVMGRNQICGLIAMEPSPEDPTAA